MLICSIQRTGKSCGGDQYDRNLTELFSVQDEISHEVTQRLRLKMTGEAKTRLSKRYTENIEAYQLYVRARRWCEKRSAEGFKRGTEYLMFSAGSSSAWATSRQPRRASTSLPSEPQHEYTQFRVQKMRR
jgi:hypothetical protein